MTDRRVVFARIGWMKYYKGASIEDPRPVGAGAFNKKNVGAEVSNFQPIREAMYGYLQNVGEAGPSLGRIVLGADSDKLDNVLVVFVSPRPEDKKQVVVGWYKRAVVYDHHREKSGRKLSLTYTAVCPVAEAVLLPTRMRRVEVPQGKGAFGQANLCYPSDRSGRRKRWVSRIVDYIDAYKGPNVVVDSAAEIEDDAAESAEHAAAAGQGMGLTAEQRRSVETLGMRRATAFLRAAGYSSVVDVSASRSWDLECKRDGKVLRVEVKATTTSAAKVIVTAGSVKNCRKGDTALYVLHSVRLNGKTASGGKEIWTLPWAADESRLTPIAFFYRLQD